MFNRRSFLKSGGALIITCAIPDHVYSSFAAAIKPQYPPIGLQTYTVRFLLNKGADTGAVLKQIAGLGVKELETATGTVGGLYYGHKPKVFASMVKDAGMAWIGNHVRGVYPSAKSDAGPESRVNLKDNLQQIVDDAAEGGCPWVVCANSAVSNLEEIKRTTEAFALTGETAKKNNIRFAYHNHQSEFKKIEGTSAYEYVLGQTNKDEVFMELDLAWAVQAGMDPVAMFAQYPGRFPLWHVKDIDPATDRPCPVGKGKVDFKRIYENSKLSGVAHTFIEQDTAKSVADIETSVHWLQKNIIKR